MESGVLVKPGGGRNYDVSDNGNLIYVKGDVATRLTRRLFWIGRDGEARQLQAEPHGYVYPRVAPDGAKAAIEVNDGRDRDIWILDLKLESLDRLTRDATHEAYPVWTPDSRRVIYTTIGPLPNTVVRRNADGTGEAETLFTTPPGGSLSTYAVTSPADSLIVRTSRALGLLTLHGTRELRPILSASEYSQSDAALSPDDKWMAYHVGDADGTEVFVSPFPNVNDARYKISIGGGRHPVWSPKGDEIFYISRDRKLMSVAVVTTPNFLTRSPVELFNAAEYVTFPESYLGRTYDVARDGKFLMSRDVASGGAAQDATPEVVFVFNWLTDVAERMRSLQR
jgi:serine/threonine-protein kinase